MQTLGRTRGPELRRPPGSLEVLVRLMRDSEFMGREIQRAVTSVSPPRLANPYSKLV
jgi:hypothetical protein